MLTIVKTMKAGSLALALSALVAAQANAQQMTWTDKGFVNVNLGGQSGSRNLDTDSTFELYGEQGSLSTTQEVGGGGLFDFSAGYKVWRNLAVGMGYSRTGSDSDVAIVAAVPDPVFFDRLRALTATASGADHSENAIYIQGTWVMPVTDTLDVSFTAGPTIFNVSQDIPSAITVNEPGPTLATTTIVDESETTVGFHFGADVNYFFTPRIGAGLLARYSFGSVRFDVANDSISVGGFQIGAGLRYRF